MLFHKLIHGVVIISLVGMAQESPAKHDILNYSTAQVNELITSLIKQEFPPELVDRLAVLAINRPEELIPTLTDRIRQQYARPAQERDEKQIEIISALIAYTGGEYAVPAVEALIDLDSPRFTPLVQSALNNSQGWSNPYDLAYVAVRSAHPTLRIEVSKWVESRIDSRASQIYWASSLAKRYPSSLTPQVIESDPLLGLIRPDRRTTVVDNLRKATPRSTER